MAGWRRKCERCGKWRVVAVGTKLCNKECAAIVRLEKKYKWLNDMEW